LIAPVRSYQRVPFAAKYAARVADWTAADREVHEKMGFHQSWGQRADQLTAVVAKL